MEFSDKLISVLMEFLGVLRKYILKSSPGVPMGLPGDPWGRESLELVEILENTYIRKSP